MRKTGVAAALLAAGVVAAALPTLAAGASSLDHPGVRSPESQPKVSGKPAKLRPRLIGKRIPFGHKRKMQMARYSKRHYGKRAFRLRNPRVIVEHYTDGPSMMSAWWTMANNTKNLGESPGVCTHFIIDKRGRIFRTVPLRFRCRHTIGLNQTSIGIEHVSRSDRGAMRRDRQRRASFKLTLWLMARYNIPVRNVIGHGESLLSPLRYERYKAWKCNTHTDFSHRTMHKYRLQMRKRARAHDVRIGKKPRWVDIGC